jgi:putative transposase
MHDAPPDGVGRKNPATGVHVYFNQPTIVLLSVNTRDREPWLANDLVHSTLSAVWRKATVWIVGEYVLMPDHLHLFCAPRDPFFSIESWIAYWKSRFSRAYARPECKWQSRGWHRRLRHEESYSEKWRYVWENPVRKGLVTRPQDWPYWGRIHVLPWHGPVLPVP